MPKNTTPPAEADAAEAQPTPTPPPLAGNRFFAWMRSLGLTREPGWIGGVSAGIAVRLGVDPLIVRGIFAVVAVLGGPALLVYAAGWLLLPDRNDKIHLEEVFKGRLDSPIAGIGALILLSMLPVTQGFWFAGNAFWGQPYWGEATGRALWTIVLLGLIVWFVVWVARRSGRPSNAPHASWQAAKRAATQPATDARADATAGPVQDAASEPTQAASYAAPGERPAAPSGTASAEEFAAWRTQQSQWKAENDAFRARQASEQRAASMAAQQQYREERAARRAIELARHARTRSGPLYSFIFIGASFVTGGLVALAIGDGRITAPAVLGGAGAMLAVLALAIIINGARGRRPGGAQGVAAIVLVGLFIAAVLPHTPNISYAADVVYTPKASSSYTDDVFVTGIGNTVLDLRDVYAEPLPPENHGDAYGNLALVSGIGNVTIVVPADAAFSYQIHNGATGSDWGNFNVTEGEPTATEAVRVINLNITMARGDVKFTRVPSAAGAN